jgi:O-antigen/teichoic acid export membrane protein
VSGGRWTAASTAVRGVSQLALLWLLAHWLTPAELGLAAVVLVLMGLAQMYADAGIANAVIQRSGITRSECTTLFWASTGVGLLGGLVILAAAGPVAFFFEDPLLEPLVLAAAPAPPLASVGQISLALLQKELHFRRVALVEMSAAGAGFAAGATLAVADAGPYALVGSQLASLASRSALCLISGRHQWRQGLHFRLAELRGFLGFGLFQLGERTVNQLTQSLDRLIVAKVLGPAAAGLYALAAETALRPALMLVPVLTRVAFPVLSRVQEDRERLVRGYASLLRVTSAIILPVLAFILVGAEAMVGVLFGPQWLDATPLLRVLALTAMLRGLISPVGVLLLARGRADLGFKWNLSIALPQLAAVVLGAKLGGLEGTALAVAAVTALWMPLAYLALVRPLVGPCASRIAVAVAPAVIASLTAAGFGWLLATLFTEGGVPWLLLAAAGSGLGYVLSWLVAFPKASSSIWALVPRPRGHAPARQGGDDDRVEGRPGRDASNGARPAKSDSVT